MPRFIGFLYGCVAVLGLAYLADHAIGSPSDTLSTFVSLDLDQNLSTWFSSLLWFGSAAFTWEFARRRASRRDLGSWLPLALAGLFLLFSIDETARLHEAAGVKLDQLLLGVDRTETSLPATGVWIVVLGVPLLIAMIALGLALARVLRSHREALVKIVVGMAIVLAGGIGVEALSNFVEAGSTAHVLQVLVEESLEMVGATTVLWGSYGLFRDREMASATA